MIEDLSNLFVWCLLHYYWYAGAVILIYGLCRLIRLIKQRSVDP